MPNAISGLAKQPRELRYRGQFFPDADDRVFKTAGGGFVPLPILLRKMFRYLSAADIRVLVYLYLRSGQYGLSYPPLDEMAHEIGISRKNLIPRLKRLEEEQLIAIRRSGGRNYYLVHDPRIALKRMIDDSRVNDEDFLRINELCEDLGLDQFEAPKKKALRAKM
jgi:hypothetical protein